MEQNSVYLGIDLTDDYAMISYFQPNKKEPETVSTIAGEEVYQIPVVLSKKRNLGQWYYGEEARRLAKTGEVICIESLFQRAVLGETIRIEDDTYEAEDLMVLFLKKIIHLSELLYVPFKCKRIAITTSSLSRENMDLLWRIAPKLGLNKEQFMVIDHKESFYFYALNQDTDLWLHDVFLFEGRDKQIQYFQLTRNLRTIPQVVTITESNRYVLGDAMDESFYNVLYKAFENKIISSVYLVGDIFDGNWMQKSLGYLCRGRRAFVGKNMYSKGACYAAYLKDYPQNWNCIYIGENEMKYNLSLKVKNQNTVQFHTLISAGVNWFETSASCEVILDDEMEVHFWKQLPNSREAKVESLELSDLPQRPPRTTRIRIEARPVSDTKVEITIKDLGFGEFFRGTNRVWKYVMTI